MGRALSWVKRVAAIGMCAASLVLFSGCFWVCRIPFPEKEQFSDDGECTNRVWTTIVKGMDKHGSWTNWTVYPLIGMRVYMTGKLGEHDDIPLEELKDRFPDKHLTGRDLYNIKWQRRFRWGQYGLLWLGSPIDAVVDTVMLPFDLFCN